MKSVIRDARQFRKAALVALVAGGTLGVSPAAIAGPEGAQVHRGQVSFDRSANGNNTTITASNGAIINYRSFDIGANESVRFIQPNARARVLNRINGATPTTINGSLFANGQVFIVNPAGVMFGNNSVVNVGRLFAAAGDISNADFISGVNRFSNVRGGIVSQGFISADAVHLIGNSVANHGTIISDRGLVTMLAGNEVYLREKGGRISVRVDGTDIEPGVTPASTTPASNGANPAVDNTGTIQAANGRVTLAAGDAVSLAVRNAGRIAASRGDVHLASTADHAANAGEIDVSAEDRGGDVTIDAPMVTNAGSISADGGGSISLNGAAATLAANDSTLSATDGGTIALSASSGGIAIAPEASLDASNAGNLTLAAADRIAVQGDIFGTADTTLALRQHAATVSGSSDSPAAYFTADGRSAAEFVIDPAAIEGFAGNASIRADTDLVVTDRIDKPSGSLQLVSLNDVIILTDQIGAPDITIEAPRDIVFGEEVGQGDDGLVFTPELLIDGETVTLTAGRDIVDRVIDPFGQGTQGTDIGTARTTQISLVAETGSVDFGTATVADGGDLNIRQADTRAQGDSSLTNAAHTNLTVTVTQGDLELGSFGGGTADALIDLRSLNANAISGDIDVVAEIRTSGAASLTTGLGTGDDTIRRDGGGDITFEEDVTALGGFAATAGRDILFGSQFLPPDPGTLTPNLLITGPTVTMTAGRTFQDRVVDVNSPKSNGAEIGSLGIAESVPTSLIDLTAMNGVVDFGVATVQDNGFVNIVQSQSRAQGSNDLGNPAGTNLRVTVTDGDLGFEQVSGGSISGPLAVRSLFGAAPNGTVTVRESIESATSATLSAGNDILFESDLRATGPVAATAGRDILFGAEFLPPDFDTLTNKLTIAGSSVAMAAGRTFEDRVFDTDAVDNGGTVIGTLPGDVQTGTSSIELTAQNGRVDFFRANVRDGGTVEITQSQTRNQSDSDLGNPQGTNLIVTVTQGDLNLERFSGGVPDSLIDVLTLNAAATNGAVTARTPIQTAVSTDISAAESITLESDIQAGAALSLDAGGNLAFTNNSLLTLTADEIVATAGGSFADQTANGVFIGDLDTRTIGLTALNGAVDFGLATVEDGGSIAITQSASRTQTGQTLGNADGTNLSIAVTNGDLNFSGDPLALRSLDATAASGITVGIALSSTETTQLDAGATATIRNDIDAGSTLSIDAGAVEIGGNEIDLAGATVNILAPIDAESATSPASLIINGDANLDGSIGAATPLASLRVAGDTDFAGGDINTTGDQAYEGDLNLAGDTALNASGAGSIAFEQNINATGTPGTIDLLVVVTPDGSIQLDGNVGAAAARLGVLRLSTSGNATNPRTDVPSTATIELENGATLFVTDFELNQNEKITSLADLAIDATGTVQLGDVNVLGDLSVNADEIQILRRPGGPVLLADGSTEQDNGVDIGASGAITFTGDIVAAGDANAAQPGIGAAGGVNTTDPDFEQIDIAESLITFNSLTDASGNLLDINVVAAGGGDDGGGDDGGSDNGGGDNGGGGDPPVIADGELIDQRPTITLDEDFAEEVTLNAQLGALARLGIPTRVLTAEESAEAADGILLASDLPASTDAFGSASPVLAARFNTAQARSLVARFEALFGTEAEDRTTQVRSAVAAAIRSFLDQTGNSEVDPEAFAEWIARNDAPAEARRTMAALSRIVGGVRDLPLTDAEYRLTRTRVVGPVTPEGSSMTPEQLAETLERLASQRDNAGPETPAVASR